MIHVKKEKKMFDVQMPDFNNMAETLKNSYYQEINDVVTILGTNITGIKVEDGVAYIDQDGALVKDPMAPTMAAMAYATATPKSQVKEGDIVVVRTKLAFVTKVHDKLPQISVIYAYSNGNGTLNAARNTLFGGEPTFMVVKTFSMFGQADGAMNPMLMAMLMNKDGGEGKDMFKTMAMMSMCGGGGIGNMFGNGEAGGMNPMVMAMIMKDVF